jgi:hypothetical protein
VRRCKPCFSGGAAAAVLDGALPRLNGDAESISNHVIDEFLQETRFLVISFGTNDFQGLVSLVSNRLMQADILAGGSLLLHLQNRIAAYDRVVSAFDQSLIPIVGNAPNYPIRYVATAIVDTNRLTLRGWTKPLGNLEFFVPRGGVLSVIAYSDNRTGVQSFQLPVASVGPFEIPRPTLFIPTNSQDFDSDNITDLAELVVGTDSLKPDTDGDGIRDGRPAVTGIIANADTPGTAVDVCAINNTAIVANSDAGVTVFNAVNGQNPIRVAQVDTPGTALAVSCSGNLIAVADGPEGLQIIDITDPPAARIVRQVGSFWLGGGSAQAVVTAADLAFVGTTEGFVNMVELTTGTVLQGISLNSGEVYDLAIEGTTLYAYADQRLFVIPFSGVGMSIAGAAASPGGGPGVARFRLFVGDNIAYPVWYNGYNTISVTNPAQPSLISIGGEGRVNGQLGWKQIVLNGSGLGVAAVGVNGFAPQNIYLHDTSNPSSNNVFLTLFDPPANAYAVSLYNGLAYAADGPNGLAVVNYLPYDNRGQPPGGVLTVSATNGTVPAGGLVRLHASVTDDVQVRKVDFYLNGQLLTADGNFPFETLYRVPTNALGGSLNFSAVVSDTGGNTTSVTNTPILVTPDTLPPVVVINTPTNGFVAVVNDDIYVDVGLTDETGVDFSTLEFLLDGAWLPAKRAALGRWIILAPTLVGFHTLQVRVRDFAGNQGVSAVTTFLVVKEAISREITVLATSPDPGKLEAISREVTALVLDRATNTLEAVSRELTALVLDRSPEVKEAISREVTSLILDRAPEAKEAISRELTVSVTNRVATPQAGSGGGGR